MQVTEEIGELRQSGKIERSRNWINILKTTGKIQKKKVQQNGAQNGRAQNSNREKFKCQIWQIRYGKKKCQGATVGRSQEQKSPLQHQKSLALRYPYTV